MPLYLARCPACLRSYEELRSVREYVNPAPCAPCGVATTPIIPGHARTPGRWGDDPGYSSAVGVHYNNRLDLDRKARAKGMVPFSDYGPHVVQDQLLAEPPEFSLPPIRESLLQAADAIRASGVQPTLDGVPISSPGDIK